MSFDPNNPKNAESPALFPAENRRNMSRLQTLFNADHQFNDPPATNDGWHKIVHWIQQGSDPIDPLSPATAAPTNAGGPPIAWEQPDIYDVDRPWFRTKNNGNLIAMSGEFEVRGSVTLNNTIQTLVTPVPNTIGRVVMYSDAIGYLVSADYVHNGTKVIVGMNATLNPSTVLLTGNSTLFPALNIYVLNTTAPFNGPCEWRLFYRYL